ncbi:UPF0481 protein At3g47200-like [Argentina anserina]|uniref:UPF0481 protein At3g47200-like n=1 Tax=Argentina anserina TaxID=57926 RepID=UPI0021764E81|nr:UPF0481 protein At3g47200-like [Potentilla anserina]
MASQMEDQEYGDAIPIFYQPELWCIYRVPNKLRNVNPASYTPQLLSIGPFHHGRLELKDMENNKRMYCENFCAGSMKTIDELKLFIKSRLQDIVGCYAWTVIQQETELVDVILVDACFIIELFLVNSEETTGNYYHLFRSPWLRKALEQDLILFENQLTYSLLQDLYDFGMPSSCFNPPNEVKPQKQPHTGHEQRYCLSCFQHCLHCVHRTGPHDNFVEIANSEPVHPFLKLTCEFFKEYIKGKFVRNGVAPKHFTDLVRHFLCPEEEMTWVDNRRISVKNIYDARTLKEAGLNFRPLKEAGLVIKGDESHKFCNFNVACFTSMDMKVSQIRVNDQTECVIRNVMALERLLYPKSASICKYFLLMDKLVDNVEDVNLMIKSGVIDNKLAGCSELVVNLINSLCLEIMDDSCCYGGVCNQLNRHYGISFWKRNVAILKRVYFQDLWTASSTIVGLFVLVFSIIGTIKSIGYRYQT